jgi:hypothetical protein
VHVVSAVAEIAEHSVFEKSGVVASRRVALGEGDAQPLADLHMAAQPTLMRCVRIDRHGWEHPQTCVLLGMDASEGPRSNAIRRTGEVGDDCRWSGVTTDEPLNHHLGVEVAHCRSELCHGIEICDERHSVETYHAILASHSSLVQYFASVSAQTLRTQVISGEHHLSFC